MARTRPRRTKRRPSSAIRSLTTRARKMPSPVNRRKKNAKSKIRSANKLTRRAASKSWRIKKEPNVKRAKLSQVRNNYSSSFQLTNICFLG